MITPAQLITARKKWDAKPSLFPMQVFGVRPREKQAEVLDALLSFKNPRSRVAYPAYRGAGKNAVEAWAMILFLILHPDGLVVTFSATWLQTREVQWREMRKWYDIAVQRKFPMGERPKATKWTPTMHGMAIGVSPKDPAKIEGFHARNKGAILVIGDECKAVEDDVWDATRGYDQGASVCQRLLASLPGENTGFFYEACENPKWTVIRENGEDSPYCDSRWREEMARDYGTDSALYQCHVCARFVSASQFGLCKPEWLEIARSGGEDVSRDGPVCAGIDFGAGGDLSAFIARKGGVVLGAETQDKKDTMAIVGDVTAFCHQHNVTRVTADEVGIGKGACDRLAEKGVGLVRYNAGNKARDGEHYRNRFTEDAWGVRTRLEEHRADLSALPDGFFRRLQGQLCGRKWKRNSSGQVVLEPKDEYKRHSKGRSPDEMDAYVMSQAEDVRQSFDFGDTRVSLGKSRRAVDK